jgi:DNA-binding CsgD family transcriptional regulator
VSLGGLIALKTARSLPNYRQKDEAGVRRAMDRGVTFGHPRNGFDRVSKREEALNEFGRTVLAALRAGLSQRHIARVLGCNRNRIYKTVRNLKRKGLWSY